MGENIDALEIERIWEDVDFYEIAISVKGTDINVKMLAYIKNEMIMELSKAMNDVGCGKFEEYNWECGKDIENVTYYAAMRVYRFNKVGKMAIDFILDNKLKKPFWMRTEFSIFTEANSLLDFSSKINSFVENNLKMIEGIYLSQ